MVRCRFIAVGICVACFATAVNADIGRVKRAVGDAVVERGERTIVAEPGLALEPSDILVTGSDGAISVTFIDNSRFSAGADSRVSLDRFVFDPTTQEGEFELEVESGSIAMISGQIAKHKSDAMRVRTPSSLLGIRGTRFIVEVKP